MRTTILAAKPVANLSAAAAPITILKCKMSMNEASYA